MWILPAALSGRDGASRSPAALPRQRWCQDVSQQVLRLAAPDGGLRLRVSAGLGPASPTANVLDVSAAAYLLRAAPPIPAIGREKVAGSDPSDQRSS
ncbi:hypothetical protein GCM10025786_02770 [Nocardioides caeni]